MPLLPGPAGRGVIALVGAGGKTSALFGLGEELALGGRGAAVLLTTTTHIYDPRLESGRSFDRLAFVPAMETPAEGGAGPRPLRPGGPERLVLAAREEPGTGKLVGIHPARVAGLARAWDWVVVEADGAKRLPVKAPAGHEPALPPGAGLVLGFIGLGCLGRPMDAAAVHRPERFGPVAGCAPGEPIGLGHLAALAASPQGLFKYAPSGARRVLAFNQADLCSLAPDALLESFRALAGPGADLILVCSLQDPRPEARVLARWPAQ